MIHDYQDSYLFLSLPLYYTQMGLIGGLYTTRHKK